MRTEHENLEELRAALTTVIKSEHVGEECEDANHHSLQDFLQEILDTLHECKFDGPKNDYGDSYEIECSHEGCWSTEYVELNS